MDLTFDQIYIFDINKEEAYTQTFYKGLNIITSSEVDGTDRGKSVLLRSLYHSLGAEANFDSKWNEKDKVYILKFSVDDNKYSIYRSKRLFKIFDNKNQLIFKTIHRTELSIFLGELFGFTIFLPNKNTKQLEVAPPVYSFILNYLDQDKYDGTKFSSFNNLAQYSNFKINVIYTHLGIYNKDYFELIKQKEEIESKIKITKEEIQELDKLKNRTLAMLKGFSCPESSNALENELKIETKEYSRLMNEISEIRNKLVDLRNQLEEQKIALNQIDRFAKKQEKEIKNILLTHICPECHTILNDTINIRSKRYNNVDNAIDLKDTINVESIKIKEEIEKYEKDYSELAAHLKEHNEKISSNRKEINNYIKFKGLNDLIDKINEDLLFNNGMVVQAQDDIKPIKKEIKEISQRIKSVDEDYYYLIDKLKNRFNLNELDDTNYQNLSKNFCASGSNKPLSTVIWYLTLNDLKQKYNSKEIEFPMVFDSPNNVETDQEKKMALIKFILESSNKFNQMIISSIGFSKDEYEIDSEVHINILDNDKYHLLNEPDYIQNYEILKYMNDA
ncbi:MAG: cytoplasmic protein [Ezakiella sp.]|uniref:cytoplasmic protein n=1 Tax=Fusobacterium gastrosuis TaxID=1755100 RepID=UPI002978F6DA|nr:cytoplasmic protein [Ezakiella sp.]MDD7411108.1 cytoplasmic protein [Fusobacteriaceae bacterium]MDY5714171.1 cytoplasmic protein [Fusobacterium gastrosuis]